MCGVADVTNSLIHFLKTAYIVLIIIFVLRLISLIFLAIKDYKKYKEKLNHHNKKANQNNYYNLQVKLHQLINM